jgi:peptide deformylase
MSILKIARMGHPLLLRRADEVADPTAPDIRRLLADMIETLEDAGGVGLAAPQVHVPLRIVIFYPLRERPEEETEEGAEEVRPVVLVNPRIEALGEQQETSWEGCLSLPGLLGRVSRAVNLRYQALDAEGQPFEVEAEGFHARVVQHECDHLDGVLYPMRMTDLSTLAFTDELHHDLSGENMPEEEEILV